MADFFARLAARLLDEDIARLRPNLSTRFAPAPELCPDAAPGVPPRHAGRETKGVPGSQPLPASAQRRPDASPHARPDVPSRGQPAARTSASAARPAVTLPGAAAGKQTEPGAPTSPAGAAPPAPAGGGEDDSRPIPADPARKTAGATVREQDFVPAPGEERRPYPGSPPSRQPAAVAWEPTASQPREAGDAVPGGDSQADGVLPAAAPAESPAPERPAPPSGDPAPPPVRPAPAAGESAPPRERPLRAAAVGPEALAPAALDPAALDPARMPTAPPRPPVASVAPVRSSAAHPAEPSPPPAAVRGGTGERADPPRRHRTGGGEPARQPGAGPSVTDDGVAGDDARGARPGAPPATTRRDPPSEPRLTSHEPRLTHHEPARRPRAAGGTGEATGRDGDHTRVPAPDSGGAEELRVDIELLEIVERQPPSRTPSARRPPVSLSDYLTRRPR